MTHHDEDDCCGHNHHHQCCGDDHHQHHDEQDFAHELIDMADSAWMEVLHDKIKEQILKSSGADLDKLAKVISDANQDRWKHKLAINKNQHDYKNKLDQFFGQ